MRLAAEHGRAVELGILFFGLFPANKIDVVAVRRKRQAVVARGGRGNDFLIGAGGNMAKPERLQAVFFEGLQQVYV